MTGQFNGGRDASQHAFKGSTNTTVARVASVPLWAQEGLEVPDPWKSLDTYVVGGASCLNRIRIGSYKP